MWVVITLQASLHDLVVLTFPVVLIFRSSPFSLCHDVRRAPDNPRETRTTLFDVLLSPFAYIVRVGQACFGERGRQTHPKFNDVASPVRPRPRGQKTHPEFAGPSRCSISPPPRVSPVIFASDSYSRHQRSRRAVKHRVVLGRLRASEANVAGPRGKGRQLPHLEAHPEVEFRRVQMFELRSSACSATASV